MFKGVKKRVVECKNNKIFKKSKERLEKDNVQREIAY